MKRAAGFTILELLIAVSLLSVLAVRAQEIAAAVLGNGENLRLDDVRTAAREPARSRPAQMAHAGTH